MAGTKLRRSLCRIQSFPTPGTTFAWKSEAAISVFPLVKKETKRQSSSMNRLSVARNRGRLDSVPTIRAGSGRTSASPSWRIRICPTGSLAKNDRTDSISRCCFRSDGRCRRKRRQRRPLYVDRCDQFGPASAGLHRNSQGYADAERQPNPTFRMLQGEPRWKVCSRRDSGLETN
jgi:hypothetical protein